MTDFVITDHGSVWQIEAVSAKAKEFADEAFYPESWQGNKHIFFTDWRPARDIALRLQEDGFDVRNGGRHY